LAVLKEEKDRERRGKGKEKEKKEEGRKKVSKVGGGG
jgi:hypothetical protein